MSIFTRSKITEMFCISDDFLEELWSNGVIPAYFCLKESEGGGSFFYCAELKMRIFQYFWHNGSICV